ncbi:MAG: ROK family protein [Anaerolineae bacterium]|nr:ROK family protein [Anaerolineae bacterium]
MSDSSPTSQRPSAAVLQRPSAGTELSPRRVLVGVDIGGTKIAVAVVTPEGRILGRSQAATADCASYDAFVGALIALVERALGEAGCGESALAGIGMGCPGPLDPVRGTVHDPYTLPLPDGADIVSPLRRRFGVPAVLEVDTFAAALGEHWLGAGAGRALIACVMIGTGIGCGIVRDGRIARGAGGAYPEIGHHAIDPAGPPCYCGARGCWEALASGTAIGQAGQQAAASGDGVRMLALAGGRAEGITSGVVFQAAREGDEDAGRIVERAVQATAIGVHNIVHFLAPDAIIFGGGVMRHYDLFAPAIEQALARITIMPRRGLFVGRARLGPDAGILGAARAVAQALPGERDPT